MANEIINVPNWGSETLKVFKEPYGVLRDFAKKHKLSFYHLEYLFNRYHRQIPILYSAGVHILSDVEVMANIDEFKRFIKKDFYFVEFKWRNRVQYVVPFDCFEVSKGIIAFMKFENYTSFMTVDEYTIDFGRVIKHLEYMFDKEVVESADFDVYMDYWMRRILYDVEHNEDKIVEGRK